MEKVITWEDYNKLLNSLLTDLKKNKEEFDLILGLGRGGLIPAVYFSHQLNLPMIARMVSSYRDRMQSELIVEGTLSHTQQTIKNKRLLLVDDIVDSARTLKCQIDSLQQDPNVQPKLIRTAVVVLKTPADFTPDYYALALDKKEWCIFPYENL